MKGRTRSFFEDVFVLLIIGALIVAVYYFFFYGNAKQEQPVEKNETIEKSGTINTEVPEIEDQEVSIQDQNTSTTIKKVLPINTNEQQQNRVDKNISNEKTKHNIQQNKEKQESIKTNSQEKNTTSQKVDPKRIAYLMKNVDLKILKEFKETTKQRMKDTIALDNNISKEKQAFSIRVTVLKSGNFEQLVFSGGNRDIFNKNQENLTSIFPLTIDPKIIQDFPRYLRYTFKFTQNDN